MRDSIRSELLENISLSILLVPILAIRYAGDYHPAALIFGLAFFALYAALIYLLAGGHSGSFKLQGYMSRKGKSGYNLLDMCTDIGGIGCLILIIYIVRFLIRAGFAVYVAATVLSSDNTVAFWVAAVSLALIGLYGAAGDYARRRIMGNVLIYWMVVPIVLLVVYSISRMDYAGITEGLVLGNYNEGVFGTAWILVAVMSTFELLLFSFARSRRTESRHISDLVRVAVWVVVSVLLAYVYILGMLGNRCVASGNRISLGNKLDYVFIMCWLIGAFFVISSYIFYAKEVMNTLVNDRTITMYALIFAGVLFFVSCFNYEAVRIMMINWLVYGDVLLSLGLPAFVISAAKRTVR